MTIIIVHHDPLAMAQFGDFVPYPFKRRIEITHETGQYSETGAGFYQIPQ